MIFNVSGANLVGIRGINLMFAYQSFIKKKRYNMTLKKKKKIAVLQCLLYILYPVSVFMRLSHWVRQ